MLKPEQIPDAVALAAHNVFWDAIYDGKPIDLEMDFDRLFHYAIAAAINSWPGMDTIILPRMAKLGQFVPQNYIRLPLPQEKQDG